MTAQQLAEELEVSVRTVYRDVEALGAAGIPIYGEAGHAGGYRLVDGYRTRLTGLTSGEAESLFLSGLPGPAADLGLDGMLSAAQRKLMAALPDEQRARTSRLQQRFHLDLSGWYAEDEVSPRLSAVADAVWRERRVRIRYRRWRAPQEVTRTLEPYGIVLKGGVWYMVACAAKHIRTYRVSQILRAQILDASFDRPAGFDLAKYWRSYLDDFNTRRHRGAATVRLSRRIFDQLPDLLEPIVVRAAQSSARPGGADDAVQVEIPIETVEHATRMLLALGPDAEVLAPAALRQQIAGAVTALDRIYRAP
jgi:predicted DNA-binding transcriptional regulator YafY